MNRRTSMTGNGRGTLVLQRLMMYSALAIMFAIALPLLPLAAMRRRLRRRA